jgi:CheY-like chemotaxis protein
MNLLLNACDAIGDGAGSVAIAVRPLDGGRRVEVSVADNGCGMDEATKARIFEPLFTTKPKGNGLGLASVRSVMDTLGGEVLVESEPGKGTTFRLLFPVEGVQGEEPAAATASAQREAPAVCATGAQEAAAPRPTATTILVVDDDAAIVKLLKIILGKAGYGVVTAQSGEEGLEAYHAAAGAFAVCLIDASMGAGMSGLDLCAAIRAEAPSLPLILMSAYRAKEMNDRMASSGVTTFLAKPFRGGDVLALCAKYAGGAA